MIDLEKLHEELKDMSIPNSEMIAWITLLSKELRAARKCIADLRCLVDRDMIGLAEKYITEFDKARRG